MLDPIAEMLTRIRNTQRAGKNEVVVKASNLKLAIAKILEKEGFIESVLKETVDNISNLKITLKYYRISNVKKVPAIKHIGRISKEGQRIYVKNKEIKPVRKNYGIAVISTSKGVMTAAEARKNGLGGEYVCEVW